MSSPDLRVCIRQVEMLACARRHLDAHSRVGGISTSTRRKLLRRAPTPRSSDALSSIRFALASQTRRRSP